MTRLLKQAKAWLGPLWWYSIILFVVQRVSDLINIFTGFWLVPKYVPSDELGAVLPLSQIGGVLGLPLAVILIPFGKFLNVFAARGELGKIKRLLYDVFLLAGIVAVLTAVCAHYLMPAVFLRLRVGSGYLTWLILCAGLSATVAPLFVQALQGLKLFSSVAVINAAVAPIRLVVLLVTLPVQGIAGYFSGQLASEGFKIGYAFFSLRKNLGRAVVAVRYWQNWREIVLFTIPVAVLVVSGSLQGASEVFVIRHRLPDVESAAYYFISRFAEIPPALWGAVSVVFLPLVSERHETGQTVRPLYRQVMTLILGVGGSIAVVVHLLSPWIFALIPSGNIYQPYTHLVGVVCGTSLLRAAIACYVTYELACRRFRFVFFASFLYVLQACLLYSIGGINFFRGVLPDALIQWILDRDFMRIGVITWYIFSFALVVALPAFLPSRSGESTKTIPDKGTGRQSK
jgi:hypothetical protein